MVMQNMCFISTNKQPIVGNSKSSKRQANKQIVTTGPYTKVLPIFVSKT